MNENSRNTKVIWSFESEAINSGAIAEIGSEQVDAIRLVYDNLDNSKLKKFVTELKSKGHNTPLMVDIAAKVRAHVSGLKEAKDFAYGETLTLTPESGKGDICVDTENFDKLFHDDAVVFFGYGNALMRCEKIEKSKVTVKVIQGGTVYPKMEIHIPSTREVAKPDSKYIKELCDTFEKEIDFIVLPPMSNPKDIKDLKEEISSQLNFRPWFLLKINSEQAYTKIEEHIDEVEGVFISRLEMALTIDAAMIPVVSKEMIQIANDRAKLVVVASEMLGSMRHNATPTRAEVSDVANAVHDGADAVVLSEEVAHGPYAERAAEVMDRIVIDAEERSRPSLNWEKQKPNIVNAMDAVSYGAYKSALKMNAKAIVCITESGNTAMRLSSFRGPFPIISVTFQEYTERRLSLIRGVQSLLLDKAPSIDDVLPMINDRLVRKSWLSAGDRIVFVSVTLSPIGKDSSNLFTIQRLNEKIPRATP